MDRHCCRLILRPRLPGSHVNFDLKNPVAEPGHSCSPERRVLLNRIASRWELIR